MFFKGISPEETKCCGCGACSQICPNKAISMTINTDGFFMPAVNIDLCVECGLCEKVCPIIDIQSILNNEDGECYAAVNSDYETLINSSSGGVFSCVAERVLELGGIVCGAAFSQEMQLGHIFVSNKEDLGKLRGSKYLQSKMDHVFREIRGYLRDNRIVYFVGTGCQVGALKKYLLKDYSNLITSDILCHGVPNQKIFNNTLQFIEKKYNGKVVNYSFRDKTINGWSCSSSCIIKAQNTFKYVGYDKILNSYFYSFIQGYMNREVCYVCPYATTHRGGDITLGDFWGVQNYLKIPNRRDGVSAILVNTEKGVELINSLVEDRRVNIFPANIKDVAIINETLLHPTPRPYMRNIFFENFKSNNGYLLQLYSGKDFKPQLLYFVKKMIKSSPLLKKLYDNIRK